MHTKVVLIAVILILIGFFYLHTQNPSMVSYTVSPGHTYEEPATVLVFAGFLAGIVIAALNSLAGDARRALHEIRVRREQKVIASADEAYRRGLDAMNHGDNAGARGLIERAIKAKPNDSGVIQALAETYIRESKPMEALKILESGLVSKPESVILLNAVATCAFDAGETRRAAKALEGVVELDPKNLSALRRLREIRIKDKSWSDAASLQKNIADCVRDEASKRRERRLLAGLLFEAAVNYLEDGRLADSVGRVKEVLKIDPAFMPAHMLLGEAIYRQGNTAGAIKVWEKAYGRYPASEPLLLKLEDAYIRAAEPDKILDKYKKEILSRPNNINLRVLLSRLYLRLEMVDAAIESLERITQEAEDAYYPKILLAEAYLRRKQTLRAAQLFQKALVIDKDKDKEFYPPFECSSCREQAESWEPRCPACGEWNTLVMAAAHRPAPARDRKE